MNSIIVRNCDDATHARLDPEADARDLGVDAPVQHWDEVLQ
ncbi:MAG: hypothetical protein ABI277_03125 [Burkholderiaceae bacterium]